jgi:hypothetical protein
MLCSDGEDGNVDDGGDDDGDDAEVGSRSRPRSAKFKLEIRMW